MHTTAAPVDAAAQPITAVDARLAAFDIENAALIAAPVVAPLESLQRLVLRDRGRRRSNAYMEHVQQGGMTASWRQKMIRWMFEVGYCSDDSSFHCCYTHSRRERKVSCQPFRTADRIGVRDGERHGRLCGAPPGRVPLGSLGVQARTAAALARVTVGGVQDARDAADLHGSSPCLLLATIYGCVASGLFKGRVQLC